MEIWRNKVQSINPRMLLFFLLLFKQKTGDIQDKRMNKSKFDNNVVLKITNFH